MENMNIYKKSISLLRDFVNETPKDELSNLIKSFKDLNIEGPTFEEYLNGMQQVFEIIGTKSTNKIVMKHLSDCDIYQNVHNNLYYVPPPPVKNKTRNKKSSSIAEELFFCL